MIKVFNSDDKTYETNGNVVLNPTYANIHKEDNGDYYLDLETSIEEDKIKHIEHEEGTTIETTGTTLTDVDTTKEHKFLSLYGETQQDSTTGKNIYYIEPTTKNGVTLSYANDGAIVLNGTSNSSFIQFTSNVSLNGTYTLSVSNNTIQANTYVRTRNANSTLVHSITLDTIGEKNATKNSEISTLEITIGASGVVFNNFKIYCQLESGSTATTFEKATLGASPNPDYPQPIHNVSGDNTIEICGKNLFGFGITAIDKTSTYRPNSSQRLVLTAGDNINEVKFNYASGSYCTGYFEIANIDGTLNYTISFDVKEKTTQFTPVVAIDTTNSTTDKLVVMVSGGNGSTRVTTSDYFILNNIMVRLSSTSADYEAYTGQTQLISLGSIELCKIGDYQDIPFKAVNGDDFYKTLDSATKQTLTYGKWYLHKEIEKVVLSNLIWTHTTSSSREMFYSSDLKNIMKMPSSAKDTVPMYATNYIPTNQTATWKNGDVCVRYSAGSVGGAGDLIVVNNNYNNTTDFINNSSNSIIYYPLANSTDTEITDTTLLEQLNNFEKMKLYNGITNISITPNDLTPIIKLHYNYIEGGDVVINNNDYIKSNNIIVANTPTGEQAFRITDIEKRKHKIVLKAWHISYDTKNYVIQDSYVVDKTCNQAMDHLNNATDNTSPFTTTSDITTINSYRCVRKSLFEAFNVVLERWGGHFVRDNWNFKIMNSIGQDNGVVVRYAKNLKDIQVTYDWTNVVTKILPVGNDGLLLDEVFLYADIQYDIPYTKVVHFDQNIDEDVYRDEQGVLDEDAYLEALKNDLRSQATLYLQENYLPQVNYSLNANLEKITDIGDTIQVKDERLGVDITTNLISYDYDCILEKYTNLEFGNFTKSISDLTSYINSQTSQIVDESVSTTRITLENELDTATSQIWGVLGSSYVLNEGDKILIVDSLPKETATNVIMINSAGIGFSQTGINGTFSTALTIDGTFNTSNVNVINFTADLIKGGALKLGSNLNQNGILEVYDEANNLIALLNKDGLRMNAVNGAYVLINQQVGFAGYDKNDNPIYWVSEDEFHMKKSVVEEEITLVDKMRIIPITITDNGTITNDGIGFVSTL